MPEIVDLTQPRGKYGDTFQGIANILDTIGKVERLRQDRALNSKIINVVAMGGGPQEIAQALVEAQPQYSTGAAGFLQQIASQFAPPSMIESQVGQMGIASAFQKDRIGAMPWAAAQMTEPQRQNWLDNYGRGITIQTGQKLLSEADRLALAKADRDKALGIAGPGFGPGDKKALAEEMDAALDNAKTGFYGIGRTDYKEDALFREWKNFIAKNTFANDNQRENTLAVWQSKVTKRGKDWLIDNEVDWDPTDPKWREAIGLKAEVKTNEGSDVRGGSKYKIGDVIPKGGRQYKIIGFDTDGEPLVEPIQ